MYKYPYLIPENIAPVGARRIGVYDSTGKRVCSIPLGRLSPSLSTTEKLYSFCALADIHLTHDTANEDFQRALTYAGENCDFTCIAGDLTDTGADESQMALFKSHVDAFATKPVYAITGNHENYNGYADKYLEEYTGKPLYYTITNQPTDEAAQNYYNAVVGDDVFIMVGHYGSWHDGNWQYDEFISTEELQWLYRTLEANRNKRCFVFNHTLPLAHGVGNPEGLYAANSGASNLWRVDDGGIGQVFINLLRHYKNTILFHGHSHTRFALQTIDSKANYSSADGYRSVHIPSLSVPRDKDPDGLPKPLEEISAESEGYIVDVYDDCIVLNGRDFIDNDTDGHILAIATYKIDTTLQTIEANTFIDNTGAIVTG